MNRGGPRGPGRGPGGGSAPVEKAQDFKGSGLRLLSYLKPFRLQLMLAFIMLIAGNLFSIFAPRIVANAIDLIAGAASQRTAINFQSLGKILLTLGLIYLGSALFQYLQQRLMVRVSNGTV